MACATLRSRRGLHARLSVSYSHATHVYACRYGLMPLTLEEAHGLVVRTAAELATAQGWGVEVDGHVVRDSWWVVFTPPHGYPRVAMIPQAQVMYSRCPEYVARHYLSLPRELRLGSNGR